MKLNAIGNPSHTVAMRRRWKLDMRHVEEEASRLKIPALRTTLVPFQRIGVAQCLLFERVLLAADTGTGKTVMAIAAIEHADAYPALIVSPASMKYSWEASFEQFVGRQAVVLEGIEGEDEEIERARASKIVILNYDLLEGREKLLASMGFRSAVYDESHYLKTWESGRSEVSRRLMQDLQPPMILALSATPLKNRPNELPSQLEVIQRLEDFGGRWAFQKRYTDARKGTHGWDFSGASNTDELAERLRRTCMVRFKKTDVLRDLPAKRRCVLTVGGLHLEQYHKDEEALAQMLHARRRDRSELAKVRQAGGDDQGLVKKISAGNADALVRMTALRKAVGQAKFTASLHWIQDYLASGEKLVVFAIQKDLQERLVGYFEQECRSQGYEVAHILSADSSKDRTAAEKRFQQDPNCRLIIVSFGAGQEGLTLTAARASLTLEYAFSPMSHLQAEDRIWRMGQNNAVNTWYATAKGTIDDDLRDMLTRKMEVIESVVDGGKNIAAEKALFEELCRRLEGKYPETIGAKNAAAGSSNDGSTNIHAGLAA